MNILENDIDTDSFIKSLEVDSEYTRLFLTLLNSATTEVLNSLILNKLDRFIMDMKYLIKYKYNRLTSSIRHNIIRIVVLLLDYNINIDTLIINVLRNDSYAFSSKVLTHKYFNTYKMAYYFISYHLRLKVNKGRDFHTGDTSIPTPHNYLSSAISIDTELDTHFLCTVSEYTTFYIRLYMSRHVQTDEKARNVIRFIITSTLCTSNIILLVNSIVKKYPSTRIYVFYDVIHYNGEERINEVVQHIQYDMLNKYKDIIKDNIQKIFNGGSNVLGSSSNVLGSTTVPRNNTSNTIPTTNTSILTNTTNTNVPTTSTSTTLSAILDTLRDMSFTTYYSLVVDMKSTGTPFISSAHYREVIHRSFTEDNYVQVYLWKILHYQKVLFSMEIEIDENELSTLESKDGYDMYLNIVDGG